MITFVLLLLSSVPELAINPSWTVVYASREARFPGTDPSGREPIFSGVLRCSVQGGRISARLRLEHSYPWVEDSWTLLEASAFSDGTARVIHADFLSTHSATSARSVWSVADGRDCVAVEASGFRGSKRALARPLSVRMDAVCFDRASCSTEPLLERRAKKIKDAKEAAELAAQLANEQCELRFHAQPFKASRWRAIRSGARWSWGRMDVAGPEGYSAIVSFDENGQAALVQLFLAHDGIDRGPDGTWIREEREPAD